MSSGLAIGIINGDMPDSYSGLLINYFPWPRNCEILGTHEIPRNSQNTQNTMKFARGLFKYMLIQHI